jgi:hypothetical protein
MSLVVRGLYHHAVAISARVGNAATLSPSRAPNMAVHSPDDVGAKTCIRSPSMPDLGLAKDLGFEWRVYVLACAGGFTYVGIEYRYDVGDRVREHFQGEGAYFSKSHRPQSILFCWPAANRAVEGYVFLALLAQLPPGSVRRLGGWTQTSTNPSPISKLVYEQERRCMLGQCFNCGSKAHFASKCPKATETAKYKCQTCSGDVLISSRGASSAGGDSSGSSGSGNGHGKAVAVQAPAAPAPVAAQVSAGTRRALAAEPAAASAAGQRGRKRKAPTERAGKQVLALGECYSALSWHAGTGNPSPSLCAKVRRLCSASALELQGGHCRSLDSGGFVAAPPLVPRSLTGDRARLGSVWVNTEVHGIQIRRALNGELQQRLSQVLFRVPDLVAALSS